MLLARNVLVSYADGTLLLAQIPSGNMRSEVTNFLDKRLGKMSAWVYFVEYEAEPKQNSKYDC